MTNEEIIDIIGPIEYVPGDVPRANEVNAIISAVVQAWQKLFQVSAESSQGVGFASDGMNFFAHKDMSAFEVFTIDKDAVLPDDPNIETERPYFVSRDINEDESADVPLFFIMADIPSGPGLCYSLSFAGARKLRVASPVELGAQAKISGTSVVPSDDGPLVCVAKDTIIDGVQHFVRLAKGSGGDASVYGIVTEEVPKPATGQTGIPSEWGRIHVFGKSYEVKDGDGVSHTVPDDAVSCVELAETEVLLTGLQTKIVLDGQVDNPEFDDQADITEWNPEKIDHYRAVDTLGEYTSTLDTDLTQQTTTTIPISFGEEGVSFTVHCLKLKAGEKLLAGMGVTVSRTQTAEGLILEVMLGPCPL